MRKKLALVVVAIVAVGFSGLWWARADQKASGPVATAALGAAAPAFNLSDGNGKTVNSADFRGKVVVLEWFNPGCPFCQRHLKDGTMKNLAAKYREQGVVWLAVNSVANSTNEMNARVAAENALEYPILNDSAGRVGRAYGAKTTPDMFIIDRSGALVYSGAIDDDPNGGNSIKTNYVSKALDEVLAGKSVSMPQTKSYGCGVKYAE